jgi:hypothetical protein
MSALDTLVPLNPTGVTGSNLQTPNTTAQTGPTPGTANITTDGTTPESLVMGELAAIVFNGVTVFPNFEQNVGTGYILGTDPSDNLVKFFLGTPTNYINFNGINLQIAGQIVIFPTTDVTSLDIISTAATANGSYQVYVGNTNGSAAGILLGLITGGSGTCLFLENGGTGPTMQSDGLYFSSEFDNGSVTTTATINWANGNVQYVTLTGATTFTFSNPQAGMRCVLHVAGAYTPTFPAAVRWPAGTTPTATATAGHKDIYTFIYSGKESLYDGVQAANFATT